jgi:hypothetical protein
MGHILLQTQAGFQSIGNVTPYIPIQITPIRFDGKEAVLVATDKEGISHSGRVWVLPSGGGRVIAFWDNPYGNKLVGCTWDENRNALYVIDDQLQLFTLQFNVHGISSSSREITGLDFDHSHLLIISDTTHQNLLAIDIEWGKLYRVDLPSGRAHRLNLNGTIGKTEAIAISADSNRLYSVDGKHIRTIRLDTTPVQVSIFKIYSQLKKGFETLSSLVVEPNGQMLVGDLDTHAIYIISPIGQITNVLSAR